MTQQPWGTPPAGLPRPAWDVPAPAWQPPPSTGQQPWGPPPPSWQQPPNRDGGTRVVVLGLAVALALGFLAFAVAGLVLRADSGPDGPPPAATPAPAPTPSQTEPSSEPTPAQQPVDDYDPPELPWPDTWAQAEQWLRENPFYAQDASPGDCAIARITDPAPPALEVLDVHLNHTMDCLIQVWIEPATAAGFVLPQPPVRSYDQPITTACGTSPSMDQAAAFYCSGDQRVFYAVDRNRPLFYSTSLEIDNTLAHEFGHALQGRTGILGASTAFETTAETQDEGLEYSRRLELQADCWGGMAVNALAEATALTAVERELLQQDTYSRGDREGRPRTHGSPDSGLRWVSTGLGSLVVGACNTYVASSEDVA